MLGHSTATSPATLFVGLGRMGRPMARRYAVTHRTVLFDLDTAAVSRLAEELGATALPDLDSVPEDVGVVVLMLPDSRAVESVLLGPDGTDGLLSRLSPGTLVIDMGSSEPGSTRRLHAVAKERGLGYVDAPVSGGVAKAETGELAVMVGGEHADVEAALPHLQPMGTDLVPVGPPGAGHAAKALNNLLSATNLAAAAEVLCVAQQAGIEPEVMVHVLNSSTGRSQATEVKYPKHVLPGTFASGFEMDLMLKDLAIAARLAADAEQSTPITGKAVETLSEAREHLGAAGLDHTEIVRYYEAVNHAHIRTSEERPHP
ncbi:MAG TPA: NAD(P)-dependent oxidoreductase [Marmoricola sp.]|nr:NAD(P)-dependent oxidoreductase [Marmoricola sp.]